jgi:hypothetical protein
VSGKVQGSNKKEGRNNMKKWLMRMATAVLMVAWVQHASAMTRGYLVTKATQEAFGVDFTLSAVLLSKEAISVRMEIPKKGKLQNLKSVTMRIGQGSPLVLAKLEAKPNKEGVLIVAFQIAPDLADKCSIDLVVPNVPATARDYEHFYAVELNGYVTDGK